MNLPVQTDERQPEQHIQVPDEWFVSNHEKNREADSVKRPSLSYTQDAWRRLKKNKLAMAGLFILLFLFVMAVIGPLLSPHSVARQSLAEQ
ncbi:ABC transporter permease, partial [Bacillus sp. S20C3]|nr:ABC transporter permease [Bacillus sp. S20C3]